ncbi:MAG: hypothetical protein Q9157_004857 [Trypethelium eluteriae]
MANLESHNGYYLWQYIPSIPAAILFSILFGIITVLHLWRMFRSRTWYCIAFATGGIFEFIGYVGRIFAHDRTGAIMPYVIQSVFILLAPALFAASMYMVLGRIIRCVRGEKYSIIRVSWLAKIFVGGDVFSFLIQAGGAGILVKGDSDAKTGENIIVGGLIVQVIMFGLFALSAIVFEVRMHRHAMASLYNSKVPWKETLHMLYYASLAIMVRSIVRVIQYIMGQGGYLLKKEWPLMLQSEWNRDRGLILNVDNGNGY